jgi:hypothetical protein
MHGMAKNQCVLETCITLVSVQSICKGLLKVNFFHSYNIQIYNTSNSILCSLCFLQCSSGCGHGRQTRDVVCATFLRGQYRVALDMNCPSGLKPETERPCEEKPCGPEWFYTDWTHVCHQQ